MRTGGACAKAGSLASPWLASKRSVLRTEYDVKNCYIVSAICKGCMAYLSNYLGTLLSISFNAQSDTFLIAIVPFGPFRLHLLCRDINLSDTGVHKYNTGKAFGEADKLCLNVLRTKAPVEVPRSVSPCLG